MTARKKWLALVAVSRTGGVQCDISAREALRWVGMYAGWRSDLNRDFFCFFKLGGVSEVPVLLLTT